MDAETMLKRTADLVGGARETLHGTKFQNFQNIAGLWNAYLANRLPGFAIPLRPDEVCDLMELLKVARRQHGTFNEDDYVDGAGYAACALECASPATTGVASARSVAEAAQHFGRGHIAGAGNNFASGANYADGGFIGADVGITRNSP